MVTLIFKNNVLKKTKCGTEIVNVHWTPPVMELY